MIPSDHFVRFYNEVFKYLEKQKDDALKNYWLEISRHQELHCLELFKTKGLKGMAEYWTHIKEEENCDMTIKEFPDHLEFEMHKCPSLSKVLDNDAKPMARYCDHCAGWVIPLVEKADFIAEYNIIDRKKPQCKSAIYPKSSGRKSSVFLKKNTASP